MTHTGVGVFRWVPAPRGCSGKKKIPLAMQEMLEVRVPSLGGEDPLGEEMAPTLVFLPGKFHRRRRLEGYSSWGLEEPDMTE